jgi:hypothetical protein
LKYPVISSPMLIPYKGKQAKDSNLPRIVPHFRTTRIGHCVHFKRKTRHMCQEHVHLLHPQLQRYQSPKNLSDQEQVQRRSQSLRLSHLLVSSMFLHYFFLTSVISCAKVGRGGISLYKNCLFWAFMVLHIPPIEIPTNK